MVEPLPPLDREFTLVAAVRRVDARGLPGLGRDGRPEQRRSQRSRAMRSPSSTRLVTWQERIFDVLGAAPVLAGSGSTWFVDGASSARTRCLARLLSSWRAPTARSSTDGRRSNLGSVTCCDAWWRGAAKQLLVLLLAHALAALLDQRTHEEETLPDRRSSQPPSHTCVVQAGSVERPLLTTELHRSQHLGVVRTPRSGRARLLTTTPRVPTGNVQTGTVCREHPGG